ncbi:MAG: tetratricopeptide repeat protein, partial [Persicimonas sp.]
IWAERFKGSASDLFDISEQAARAIVEALTADELDTPQPAVADSHAVDLYLKARHTMHEGWFGDLKPAIELFERALSEAPDDPRILAGAALAHARATFYGSAERAEHLERAQTYAKRALSIAPSRPEPRLALARVHFARMEYGEAIEHLQKALASAPSNADAHDEMGRILREIGPLDTAVRHIETALELNPRMYRARFSLAQAKALAGDWAQVDRLLEAPADSEQALNTREATRSRLDLWREQPQWFDEDNERPLTHDSPPIRQMSHLRRELIRGGGGLSAEHRAFVRGFIEHSAEGSRIELVARQLVAEAFAYQGDFDAALEHIELGVDHGLLDLMWLERCPLLDPLRDAPRFRACRDRIDERVESMRS